VNGWLLDTNVVSASMKRAPEPRVRAWLSGKPEADLYLSSFVFAELGKGIAKLQALGDPDARRLATITVAIRERYTDRILPIDDRVLAQWGRLAGTAAAKGISLSGIDLIMGATAVVHGLAIATRNVKHFPDIVGVTVVDPWND
jgi:predicted nucleic acid-binding protein